MYQSVIERQKVYLESIKKGEEKVTEKELEDAIYSGDTFDEFDLNKYRFQIFKIAFKKGYYSSDDICFPYILATSRNPYIRRYAIEFILNGNSSLLKPEFLTSAAKAKKTMSDEDFAAHMQGDTDAAELSSYWDDYKEKLENSEVALKLFSYMEISLPIECQRIILNYLNVKELKNIASFFKPAAVSSDTTNLTQILSNTPNSSS